MAGRPKSEDSREKQYRVRLNAEEDEMLTYSSEATGVRKSEIFRQALRDYYEKVRLQQYDQEMESEGESEFSDIGEDGRLNLNRVFGCPHCGEIYKVDVREVSTITTNERLLGAETVYTFGPLDFECKSCGNTFHASGRIVEYPTGVVNDQSYTMFLDDVDDDVDENADGEDKGTTTII